MSEDLSGSAGGISLPIWTAVDATIHPDRGFPAVMVFNGSPGYGSVFPLFTDEISAERYVRTAKEKSYAPLLIPDADSLLRILRSASTAGLKYVAIDCPTAADARSAARHYLLTQDLIAAFGGSE